MVPDAKFLGQRTGIWDLLKELTGVAEPERHLRGFTLRLGDGSHWWVVGLPPASYWVERLASMLHLRQEVAYGDYMMVILEGKTPLEGIKRLPDSGWTALNNSYLRLWYRMDSPNIVVELTTPLSEDYGYISLRSALRFVFRQSIQRGGLPLHAALVEHQGKGVLLVGTSGTGKSTCCRRLSPPWQARCDDEVLLTLAPDGRYLAHPFPTWSDYLLQREKNSFRSQTEDPSLLAGIFFIEQSPFDECLPVAPAKALVELITATQVVLYTHLWYCDPEEARSIRGAMFTNACNLIHRVPLFNLRVSLTGGFWEHIEAALTRL